MRKFTFIILLGLLSLPCRALTLSDSSRISLLSCAPGEVLYERYGHTAIRVQDKEQNVDVVFNYGLFSFNTKNFYLKFMRGETMYQLGAESYEYFAHAYRHEHRKVSEQVLNLNQQQREQIWEALLTNLEPKNREYLYNFVFDNCATRPYKLICSVLGDSIHSTYTGYEGTTYRNYLSHYTRKGSWEDFGINLLFGPRADKEMHGEDRLFLPEELMNYLSQATLPNGEKVVLEEDIQAFEVKTTPWYLTCYAGLTLLIILLIITTLLQRRKGKYQKWPDIIFGILYGIILLIVTFLTFFSIHPLVGFGWRLIIIPLTYVCIRLLYFIK